MKSALVVTPNEIVMGGFGFVPGLLSPRSSMSDTAEAASYLLCSTCLDVFCDPCTVTPCGHSFCHHCACPPCTTDAPCHPLFTTH